YNGDFLTSLHHCVGMFEQRLNYVRKFKQVIRYPLVLSGFFFILLFFFKTSVLSAFDVIFAMNSCFFVYLFIFNLFFFIFLLIISNSSVSFIIFITIIHLLFTSFFITCIDALLFIMFWKLYRRNFPIHKQIAIYQKIPIYRMILKLQTSYYFSTHITMYLKA